MMVVMLRFIDREPLPGASSPAEKPLVIGGCKESPHDIEIYEKINQSAT
jgi:hypothetical protein